MRDSGQTSGPTLGAAAYIVLTFALWGIPSSSEGVPPGSSKSGAATRGIEVFQRPYARSDGLGPDFNATSCSSCHESPAIGGGGTREHTLVRWLYGDGADALGVPTQRFTLNGRGRTLELPSITAARRRTPALFGLGQLEAIPLDVLAARSDPSDANRDGISGRLPWRDDCFGRFGWQSTVCDIPSFVEGALSRELGIDTFPRSRREISEAGVADLVAFVRDLAPPAPASSQDGADLFARAQCSTCHLPVTGIVSVGGTMVAVEAFTDLLVHEMGSGPRHEDRDSRTEFRTPPLWGVAATGGRYLHDGLARTIEEAIRRHGGEATESRRLFSALSPPARRRLLSFVATR